MKLYYYSILRKEFSPLFPNTVNTEELQSINRYKNTTRGILPLIAWALWAGGAYLVAKIGGSFVLDTAGKAALALIQLLAEGIFWAAGKFLEATGFLLDMAIQSTISSNTYDGLEVIKVGWSTVRDFSNMFFIFALLYIAIKTILGMGGSSTKKWVANLIIAALLINFSLFATKVVVDAGNVLAMGFWGKMEMTVGGNNPSAALHLMQGLKIQSIKDVKDARGNIIKVEPLNQILIYLGGALVMLVAGYVFLAGAVMMIVRTVTLLFLMIVSPFAFLSFALPVGGGFGQKWLSKLIGNTFVAPAFLAMLYLVIVIVNGLDLNNLAGANGAKWGGALAGDPSSFIIIYNYVLLIILILASLTVANSVSAGAGSAAGGYAKKGMGMAAGAAAGAGGLAYRQTAGRYARAKLNDKELQAQAKLDSKIGVQARAKLAQYEREAKGTGDIRNIPGIGKALQWSAAQGGVNIGQGSKANMYEGKDKKVEDASATAKRLFPGNDEAQARYIKEKTGDKLDLPQHKELKAKVDADLKKVERVKKLDEAREGEKVRAAKIAEDKKARHATIDADGTLSKEEAAKQKKVVDAEVDLKVGELAQEVATAMKESLAKMSAKDTADIAGKYSDSAGFAMSLNRSQHAAIQAKQMSDKPYEDYKDAQGGTHSFSMQTLNENAMMLNDELRPTLANQAKLKTGPFAMNLEEQLGKQISRYDASMARITALPDGEQKNLAMEKLKTDHDSAIQDIMAGMSPKEIARMNDDIKSDGTVVSNYTNKHYDEIVNYHKNIKVDKTDEEKLKTKTLLEDIGKKARATPAGKKYMGADTGKAYGGGKAKVDVTAKEKSVADAKKVMEEAAVKMEEAQKNPNYVPGEKDATKNAYAEAQKAHNKAQAELTSARNSKPAANEVADDEDDDTATV